MVWTGVVEGTSNKAHQVHQAYQAHQAAQTMSMIRREWENDRVHVEESPQFTVITLTLGTQNVRKKEYCYADSIRPLPDGSLEVLYQGTETGRYDEQLLAGIVNPHPFKVYYRVKSGSFAHLGIGTDVSIHTPRGADQRLIIRIVIRNVVNRVVPRYVEQRSREAIYKADVMVHAGVIDRERNQQIVMNSKSLVNGFCSTI